MKKVSLLIILHVLAFNRSGVAASSLESQQDLGSKPEEVWVEKARDLFTGADQKRTDSLTWFAEHPAITEWLIDSIEDLDHQNLALDTLVLLGREEIIPTLLRGLVRNQDGSYALALAALLSKETAPTILPRFQRLLDSDRALKLPSPLVMAVLDTLGRLGTRLSSETLYRLSRHPWPEVRSSLVQYLRGNAVKVEEPIYSELLATLTQDSAYQIQLQSLHLHLEKPSAKASPYALRACRDSTYAPIQSFCRKKMFNSNQESP